jgi:hypothetical protein
MSDGRQEAGQMRGAGREDGTDDELILAIIGEGVEAGANWVMEREYGGHPGFAKLARKHTAIGEWLMRELCGEGTVGPLSAPSPRAG